MTGKGDSPHQARYPLDELRHSLQRAKDRELEKLNSPLYAEGNALLARLANSQEYGGDDGALAARAEQMISSIGDALDALADLKERIIRTKRNDQVIQEMETSEELTKRKSEARSGFRRGVAAARSGSFEEAKRLLDLANDTYLEIVRETLEAGLLQRVRARLEVAREQGQPPPVTLDLLESKLRHVEQLLRESETDSFDVHSITDAALSIVIVVEENLDAGEVFEGERPCPDPVQPEITDIDVSVPDGGGLLTRTNIHYVKGEEVDIIFIRPFCTVVSSVAIETFPGGFEALGTDPIVYDQIEGATNVPYYYTRLGAVTETDQRMRESIRVHFRNNGDGQTLKLQITVSSFDGALTDSVELTLVAVSGVNEAIEHTIAESELKNDFIVQAYGDYGDDGRAQGVELLNFIDVDLINPQYDELEVTITIDGIFISTKFTIDLPLFCNPTVTASGRFHIVPDTATQSFDVDWKDGPDAEISFSPLCRIAHTVAEQLLVAVRFYLGRVVRDRVMSTIQNRINNSLAVPIPNFISLVQSVDTYEGEIRIIANVPNDNVVVEIPYGRLRLNEVVNFGMALNANENIVVVASGLADACIVDGDPTYCEARDIGPAGLFNWSATTPIPSPWRFSEAARMYVYFPERHKAIKQLRGLRRQPAELPFPDENAGAVVGRLANATGLSASYQFFGTPCVVNIPSFGQSRLAFGNNDYRYLNAKEFGSGAWRISVVWIPETPVGRCTSDSSMLELIDSTLSAMGNDP